VLVGTMVRWTLEVMERMGVKLNYINYISSSDQYICGRVASCRLQAYDAQELMLK
jgi:hypothetical protein